MSFLATESAATWRRSVWQFGWTSRLSGNIARALAQDRQDIGVEERAAPAEDVILSGEMRVEQV